MHSSFFVKLDVKVPGEPTQTLVKRSCVRSKDTPESAIAGILQQITGLEQRLIAMVTDSSSHEACCHPDVDDQILTAARVAHEVNRSFCLVIGDDSTPSWDEAPEWQRESSISGVKNVLAHPELTPEQSHQAWFDYKKADGWTYGPMKDVSAKTHPCMVTYDQLPVAQRQKDVLFTRVVRAVLGIPERKEQVNERRTA